MAGLQQTRKALVLKNMIDPNLFYVMYKMQGIENSFSAGTRLLSAQNSLRNNIIDPWVILHLLCMTTRLYLRWIYFLLY